MVRSALDGTSEVPKVFVWCPLRASLEADLVDLVVAFSSGADARWERQKESLEGTVASVYSQFRHCVVEQSGGNFEAVAAYGVKLHVCLVCILLHWLELFFLTQECRRNRLTNTSSFFAQS